MPATGGQSRWGWTPACTRLGLLARRGTETWGGAWQAGEAALGFRELAEGRVPLALAALLAEQAAAVHLTQCELPSAQTHVCRAAALVAAFPTLLSGLAAGVHMLAGASAAPGSCLCLHEWRWDCSTASSAHAWLVHWLTCQMCEFISRPIAEML